MKRRDWLRREVVVSDEDVAAARTRLAKIATAVAALDLLVKAVARGPADSGHHRPLVQLVVIAAVVGYSAWALPLAGTRRIATAGGLIVGAGVGNVVSAVVWGAIPNPFAIDILAVAFNLADIAALTGLILLVAGTRRLAAPPPPPPRRSPPPPVRQTQPTTYEQWQWQRPEAQD